MYFWGEMKQAKAAAENLLHKITENNTNKLHKFLVLKNNNNRNKKKHHDFKNGNIQQQQIQPEVFKLTAVCCQFWQFSRETKWNFHRK